MKTVIHRAENRGQANHGWLKAKHSFSFAQWYDPEKIHYGALRVLNDDEVAPGMGFGKHPHDNMEIITLVQEGALEHKDSMGNGSVMNPNDVQVMSAGSGVFHSEMNHSKTDSVKLFQIWVFPDKGNVTPRYDQKTFAPEDRKNKWQEIIKPDTQTEGNAIFIHQQAWFNLCDLEAGNNITYTSKKAGNGSYIFLIDGCIETTGEILQKRDAIGITDFETTEIIAKENSRILVMDIPMQF
jgi:redox-sensitive bicupin YhaK (pirin superfamily)